MASIVLGCLSVQVLVVFDLRKNWTSLKGNVASVSMTLRVLAFSFLGLIAIMCVAPSSLTIVPEQLLRSISMTFFFTTKRSPILNIVIAVVPVAAVLTFGTQSVCGPSVQYETQLTVCRMFSECGQLHSINFLADHPHHDPAFLDLRHPESVLEERMRLMICESRTARLTTP